MIYRIWKMIRMQNMHCWYTMIGVRLQGRDVGAFELLETRVCLSLNAEQGQYPAEPHIVKPVATWTPLLYTHSLAKYARIWKTMQEYSKNAGILKTNQNMHHLLAFARKSVMSSSSFGGFRPQNKGYHDRGSSVTSISSGDGSLKGTPMGCSKF